jgi:predicted outer membrane repeat protein
LLDGGQDFTLDSSPVQRQVHYRYAVGSAEVMAYLNEANNLDYMYTRRYVIFLTGTEYPFFVNTPWPTVRGSVILVNANTSSNIVFTRDSQAGQRRFIDVLPTGHLVIIDAEIEGFTHSGSGGAIHNQGLLELYKVKFTNNQSSFNGGAISGNGTLRINSSRFINNSATGMGGALTNESSSRVEIKCTSFQDNQAAFGGAIGNNNGRTLTVEYSKFEGNAALDQNQGRFSGAIYNGNSANGSVMAEDNWWGLNDGSGPATVTNPNTGGDSVAGNVDFNPYYPSESDVPGCARPEWAFIPAQTMTNPTPTATTQCFAVARYRDILVLNQPNGASQGFFLPYPETAVAVIYRNADRTWYYVEFQRNGSTVGGWITADLELVSYQGGGCAALAIHPSYLPTATPTRTPTRTPTPTATPTPSPRFDVHPNALPLHQQAEHLGLPLPFEFMPVRGNIINYLGYGPNALAWERRDTSLYRGTHGIHTGLDYGGSGNDMIAVCDGIVVPGRLGQQGSAHPGMAAVSLRCFADDPRDIDNDGRDNYSNIIVTYNALSLEIVDYGDVICAGDVIGVGGGGPEPHLHLEVHIAQFFNISGAPETRINPLFLFRADLIGRHDFWPYFPLDRFGNLVQETFGVVEGEIDMWTAQGDSLTSSGRFFPIQDEQQPGPEWPSAVKTDITAYLLSLYPTPFISPNAPADSNCS